MPKGGTGPQGRSGRRPVKKKTPPNRHTLAALKAQMEREKAGPSEPKRPSSASGFKLQDSEAEVDAERASWSGFRVLDIDKVFGNITECVACRKCRGNVTIVEHKRTGLSSLFNIICQKNCGQLKRIRNCELVKDNNGSNESEANRRLIYASQKLGFKYAGIKLLCALMDLPPPVSSNLYYKTIREIHSKIKQEAENNMLAAINQEIEVTGSKRLKGSGDGTWQRRGFTSKNGVVSLIGAETGKVMDVEVMSTVCHGCNFYKGPKQGPEYFEWKESHEEECTVNHKESSGMMEVSGMVRIFERSVDRADVQYEEYIGDGDAKTYPAIVKAKPYGDTLIPKKIECTGHVQKRFSTRLRNLKKDLRGKKLKDGKTIGGKGRLTDKKIDQFASFYGNAIRSSKTVQEMKDKVWAIYFHYRSTDKHPQHHLCPQGDSSWCKYQKAVSQGNARSFKHASSLPVAVMDAIKPTFTDLTKDDLLVKCVGGYTQNPNESFNAIVWKNVPKTVFCGLKVLEIGVYDAVLLFNSGHKSCLQVMKNFGVVPGIWCVKYCNYVDNLRVSKANQRALEATKEARKAKDRKIRKKKRPEQLETARHMLLAHTEMFLLENNPGNIYVKL